MATGGNPFPIWDRRNVDQQQLVDKTPCRRLLQVGGVVLRRNLLTDTILPHLLQLQVLDTVELEGITHDAPRAVIVDRLVWFLQTCVMWQFHALFRACAVTGQKHLIAEVGLEPADYITIDEEAHLVHPATERSCQPKAAQPARSSTSHSSHCKTMPAQLLKAVVHHCKNCKRCLMRRNLYDFGDKDAVKVINTTTCYIKIDPLCKGDQGKMREITEKDILLALPGEEHPRVIRLEGQPGVGKTELTHHIVYDWSVEFLKRVGEEIPIEMGGDMFTTMVYIPARNIKTTVPEAILDNIRCSKEDKPIMYDHVTKGYGTAIALDAIDEIRDRKVMENVKEYIQERQMSGDGPVVLVTTRTDLCPISIKDIDRFVTVQGFSINQGISYIKAYLGEDGEVCQKVLDYVHAHQVKLYPIITNPLRLHIFCALVSEGELELDENDDFCILKLFTLLEKCLLKREGKEVTEVQLHNFYRMCMYGLLMGLREFPKDLLDRFNIAEACHVFFSKKDTTDVYGKQVTFSFPHETMYEFFAGKYIETLSLVNKKSLLLGVCSQPAFRNLQKIMFEVILQQEQDQQELLLLMIRAIIILQYERSESTESFKSNEGQFRKMKRLFLWQAQYDELTHLKSKVQPVEPTAKMLLDCEQPKEAKNTSKVCNTIHKAFDGNSDFLRQVKWYQGLGSGVFGHVSECLKACSLDQRQDLTSKTTEQLLPCDFEDKIGQHVVHTVGGSRWAEGVKPQVISTTDVHAWCPADVQEFMHKVRVSGNTTEWSWLDVHLTTYQDTWGQPDSSAFCTQTWNELYEEMAQWAWTVMSPKLTNWHLYLAPSTPLHGLLQSNVGHILYGVDYGTIGIEELYQVCNTPHLPYTQTCVEEVEDCYLHNTTIVVPAGGDKSALSKMKDELLSKENPKVRSPKFITETGEKYDWS